MSAHSLENGVPFWATRRTIADHAAALAELRASEARFAGILAIAADAIISIDETGAIVHFNLAAESMFGYPVGETIGKSLDLLLPERRVAAHRHHVAGFAASGETARRMGERREVSGRRRDGTVFPADVSISQLATPGGKLFTAVVRDVTEQRRKEHHEHTLAVAGARLAGTLEYDAMLELVVQLAVHSIGDWCMLDMIEGRDGMPPTLRRLVSPHSDLGRHTALQSIAARGIDWDSPSEAIDVLRTGQPRVHRRVSTEWLEAHAVDAVELSDIECLGIGSCLCVPLSVHDQVIGALTIGRHEPTLADADLVLARALADQAALAIDNTLLYRRAQRALAGRDEVLAVVSHDLRTPASAITMCARTLLEHPPADADDRRALYATILESAAWMHRLMQDLLDAASIDAGRLAMHLEAQAVAPMLSSAVESFAERARVAAVRFDVDVTGELPAVLADRDRVLQVLGNLISNALRFTGAGGAVTLAASRHAHGVVISVRDTGMGIAPEHLSHLFDRFWQVSRSGVASGSGLGLAIAQGIVHAHHGRIWVESEIGQGSMIAFVLPAAAIDVAAR
jgi:PAS domain S-box-containing protein